MANASNSGTLPALRWLIDAGADEAIGDAPVDRFTRGTSSAPFLGVPSPEDSVREAQISTKTDSDFAASGPVSPHSRSSQAAAHPDVIGHALEIAAQCNTLVELRTALEGFQGSQLKRMALNTVFSDGEPSSRIIFIGEAPGREEDRDGRPFVGIAGKLLDLMLASINLDRTSAYITNVLPWRPPDNRTPEATEVAQCIPFLRRHIELVQPEIMVLLGAVAVRHVLGLAEGIMKYRGRWLEYRVGDAMIPVMPTLHPAYLLRQPAHKKLAWRDLQAVEKKLLTLSLLKSA